MGKKQDQHHKAFLRFLPLPTMVQDLDFNVVYTNPAFTETFGWTTEDLKQNPLAHVPPELHPISRSSREMLRQAGEFSDLETKRLTKDGRTLDVVIDGAVLYQGEDSAGTVITLRDVTQEKKNAKQAESLFAIAEALHHHSDLDSLLSFISRLMHNLLGARHAHIILVDQEKKEYYFRAGMVQEPESYKVFSESRVTLDDSYFAGQVITSGKAQIINDVASTETKFVIPHDRIHNIIGVPMELGHSICGALVGANKHDGDFKEEDLTLLKSIADIVSLPIENTRINDELRRSYDEIKSLNRAKDRIIEHLSHELRTPVAVLSASLAMLEGQNSPGPVKINRILERCQRNLKRLVEMQAKISDITSDMTSYVPRTLTGLLALCSEELDTMTELAAGHGASQTVRRCIERFFKPQDLLIKKIDLGTFVHNELEVLRPQFSHRNVKLNIQRLDEEGYVLLPEDVLRKIVVGLTRNAVEYTPDGGEIQIITNSFRSGCELIVEDTGIGITSENQRLILGNYFTTADISSYATSSPFNFNAGGSGFDLIRLKVFSEKYGFTLSMESQRCHHIPTDEDICPGSIAACSYCTSSEHCRTTGGTRFSVQFPGTEDRGD